MAEAPKKPPKAKKPEDLGLTVEEFGIIAMPYARDPALSEALTRLAPMATKGARPRVFADDLERRVFFDLEQLKGMNEDYIPLLLRSVSKMKKSLADQPYPRAVDTAAAAGEAVPEGGIGAQVMGFLGKK